MRALVIIHDHLSSVAAVGERFVDHGYELDEFAVVPREHFEAPGIDVDFPRFDAYDSVVVLGAPWSVYDDEAVGSWVAPEIERLREADARGIPVLGICFGGQLLAAAHGGSVARSPHPEIGWSTVQSDDEHLVPSGEWFQWHFDRWATPPGAVEIARNDAAVQAFTLRRNLGVQFHPELDSTTLQWWLDNGGARQAIAHGHDLDELMAKTRDADARGRDRAHRLVDGFVDRIVRAH